MEIDLVYDGQPLKVTAESAGDSIRVILPGGEESEITARIVEPGLLEIERESRRFRAAFVRSARGVAVSHGGRVYEFAAASRAAARTVSEVHSGELRAPMTGSVADVLVQKGDSVQAYQPLLVVEAMKVLAALEAPFAGKVARIHVTKGDRVEHGATLLEIERE